jgi:hypothetical protein
MRQMKTVVFVHPPKKEKAETPERILAYCAQWRKKAPRVKIVITLTST